MWSELDSKKLERGCGMICACFLLSWFGVGGRSCSNFLPVMTAAAIATRASRSAGCFEVRCRNVSQGVYFPATYIYICENNVYMLISLPHEDISSLSKP